MKQLKFLQDMEQIIFELDSNNINEMVKSTIDLYYPDYQFSFNFLICQLIYSAFSCNRKGHNIYFNYLKEIEEKEINGINKIFDFFLNYIIPNNHSQESNFLIQNLIEQKFVDVKFIEHNKSLYFAHFKTKEELNSCFNAIKSTDNFAKQFLQNFEKLSKDNWKLHKMLIQNGVNPEDIAKAIQQDDVSKLQQISSQTNFNFNQTIEPSLYEKCSFINKNDVTLIDYAAFFEAIKCFKYLMLNGSNLRNTGKYAVASGNLEIIHICEQNHSTFEYAYETAIMFHRNEIFHYLYENEIIKIKDLSDLGKIVFYIIIIKYYLF